MKRRIPVSLATVSILVCTPASAQDTELWQNADFGMSPAEVREVHADAVEVEDPARMVSGAMELLRIGHINYANTQYAVRFFFNDDSLEQVTLRALAIPELQTFENAREALSEEFGEPAIHCESSVGRSADWILDNQTNVSLVYFERPFRLLNIAFQRRFEPGEEIPAPDGSVCKREGLQ